MPNIMEHFTQRARPVLSLAQAAAMSMDSAWIDSDHLLLGLLNEADGTAAQILTAAGLDAAKVAEIARQQSKERRFPAAQFDLSADAKRTLELAVDEARRIGHAYIGAEHLLLGLLRLQDGAALNILRKLDVSREQIRQQVIAVIEAQPEAPSAPEAPSSYMRPAFSPFDYFLLRMSSRSSGQISHLPIELFTSVKDALDEALKEVASSGFLLLEERHLMLGLLQNRDSAARRVLLEAGIDLDAVIDQLRRPPDA